MLSTRSYSLQIKQKLHAAQKVYQNSKKKVYQVMTSSSWLTSVTHRHNLQPFWILRQIREKIQNVKNIEITLTIYLQQLCFG